MSTLPETGDAQSFESAPLYGFLDPIPLSFLTRFRQKSSLTPIKDLFVAELSLLKPDLTSYFHGPDLQSSP